MKTTISHSFKLICFLILSIHLNSLAQCVSGDCENGFGTKDIAKGNKSREYYEGFFKNGLKHGNGRWVRTNSKRKFEHSGTWKNDQRCGFFYILENSYDYYRWHTNDKEYIEIAVNRKNQITHVEKSFRKYTSPNDTSNFEFETKALEGGFRMIKNKAFKDSVSKYRTLRVAEFKSYSY